jgi:hypothetical protein
MSTKSKIIKHKCLNNECVILTTKEYCSSHAPRHFKLNQCKWSGCINRCRKEFCHNHNPTTMHNRYQKEKIAYHNKKLGNIIKSN